MKHFAFALALFSLPANTLVAQLHNQGAFIKISGNTALTATNGVVNFDGGLITVGGTLRTSSSLINTTGATLQGDGQYHIGGNWINDATFVSGASTVTFEGTQSSSVTSGSASFYNITLNKTGGNNLLPADHLDISNTLDFQAAGNYVVLSNHNLRVDDILGYDATRHVRTTGAGFLIRSVKEDPVVFPVGNTAYNPATLANAGTADEFRIRVTNGVLSGGFSGSELTANAVGRSWFVEETIPGGSDLTLQLQWNGDEELGGFDRSMAYISNFEAGIWNQQAPAPASGVDPYILSRSGIINLSPFAVLGSSFQPTVDISGQILWKGNSITGVNNATVTFSGDFIGAANTDADGIYSSTLAGNGNLTIRPGKNVNLLNGITVGDALAIQQHLAGINTITDPYTWIAMDVNRDNTISVFDADLINQALLNNPLAFNTFNESWRFVPKNYPLTTPPWGFPEQIELTGVTANQGNQDFYGVKVGDVMEIFADPANLFPAGSDIQPLVWRVQDRMLEAGQDIQVTFTADFHENVAAFQFGLRFDPQYLELEEVEPLAALPLGDDHFGLFEAHLGEIRVVWSHHDGFELPLGSEAFHLHFKVLQSGISLSSILSLDEALLPGLVYNNEQESNVVQLYFSPVTGTNDPEKEVRLFGNWPNPFIQTTNLGFSLPEACYAQLRVLDESGRELWRQEKKYSAGYQQEQIRLDGAAGALVCELVTPWGTAVCKMISVDQTQH
ncbi:MAG: dockerin type I domain-containing protein [Saprospiraceae bacterium]